MLGLFRTLSLSLSLSLSLLSLSLSLSLSVSVSLSIVMPYPHLTIYIYCDTEWLSLYIQEDLLLKILVFVFVFVFVCVFVIVLVITRWTLALSSFRRCIICWIWCSNHENIDVLVLIGLVAENGGEERESHSKVGTLLGPTNICTWSICLLPCSWSNFCYRGPI